jgi:hypothetical protein
MYRDVEIENANEAAVDYAAVVGGEDVLPENFNAEEVITDINELTE